VRLALEGASLLGREGREDEEGAKETGLQCRDAQRCSLCILHIVVMTAVVL
jgi:hypothetical protein